jgi:hypothetical protein
MLLDYFFRPLQTESETFRYDAAACNSLHHVRARNRCTVFVFCRDFFSTIVLCIWACHGRGPVTRDPVTSHPNLGHSIRVDHRYAGFDLAAGFPGRDECL